MKYLYTTDAHVKATLEEQGHKVLHTMNQYSKPLWVFEYEPERLCYNLPSDVMQKFVISNNLKMFL